MKLTKILTLILAVVLLSCKEDEDPKPTAAGLLGEWSATVLEYEGSTVTTVLGTRVESVFTGVGKDINLTLTFNENPNTVVSAGSYTIELTTTTAGQSETEDFVFDSFLNDGEWSLNNKTLTVTSGGETQEATIVKQTDTQLVIRIDYSDIESIPGVGSFTTEVKAVYTLAK